MNDLIAILVAAVGPLAALGSLVLAYLIHRQSKVDMSIGLSTRATYHRMQGISDEINVITLTNHSNRVLHYGSNFFNMKPWHCFISKLFKKFPAFTFNPDYPPILLSAEQDDYTIKAGETKSYAVHISGDMATALIGTRITTYSSSPKKRFKSPYVKKKNFVLDTKGRHTWERYVMETFFPGKYTSSCDSIMLSMLKDYNAYESKTEYMKGMRWVHENIKSDWMNRLFNRETQVTAKHIKRGNGEYSIWDYGIGMWGYDYFPEVTQEGFKDSDMDYNIKEKAND